MARTAISYVSKDYGASHFGNFEHLFEVNISASDNDGFAVLWSIANQANQTYQDLFDAADGFGLFHYDWSNALYLYNFDVSDWDVMSISVPYTYYLKAIRSGNSLSVLIYSDSNRTTLIDTITITVSSTSYRYLSVCGSRDGTGVDTCSGYIQNLDLQEVSEIEKTASDSGSGVESSNPEAVLAAADSGAGGEESVVSPVFFAGDSGLGVESSMLNKDAYGSDAGNGGDAMKALVGAAGSNPDMRLHGRMGRTGVPSKGVNI
jgi:hypothetical protein